MRSAPNRFYDNAELLAGVREFLSRHPDAASCGVEELADRLRVGRFVPQCVAVHDVEAVLEALVVEGEVKLP